ncbi:MAG TPA: hypothetical protein VNQ74_13265, partial [Burkholderiaceae bacterium]|nr:hypothetical protein [Burkholderiaceae bacterium]
RCPQLALSSHVVPTIGFELLYAFIIVRLDRRDLVWINDVGHYCHGLVRAIDEIPIADEVAWPPRLADARSIQPWGLL